MNAFSGGLNSGRFHLSVKPIEVDTGAIRDDLEVARTTGTPEEAGEFLASVIKLGGPGDAWDVTVEAM